VSRIGVVIMGQEVSNQKNNKKKNEREERFIPLVDSLNEVVLPQIF
jgi:hypothetical protein